MVRFKDRTISFNKIWLLDNYLRLYVWNTVQINIFECGSLEVLVINLENVWFFNFRIYIVLIDPYYSFLAFTELLRDLIVPYNFFVFEDQIQKVKFLNDWCQKFMNSSKNYQDYSKKWCRKVCFRKQGNHDIAQMVGQKNKFLQYYISSPMFCVKGVPNA